MSASVPMASAGRSRPKLFNLSGAWKRWRSWPGSLRLGSCIYAAALILGAVGAIFLVNPQSQDLAAAYAPPGSPGHLLGADPLGRDVLAWIAASVRTSFLVAGSVVAISALVGTTIGLIAGYVSGVVDAVLMRLVDLQLAIPPLLLFIAASATVGTSALALVLLLSIVSWVPYARVVRTQTQIERRRASIAAARLAGAGRGRILFVHLLPPAAMLVLVLASLQMGFVLLWEASLSFVGLGLQPPTASLGFMMAQGLSAIVEAWWIVVFPGLMLAALLVAANLIGDGLQERFGVDADVLQK